MSASLCVPWILHVIVSAVLTTLLFFLWDVFLRHRLIARDATSGMKSFHTVLIPAGVVHIVDKVLCYYLSQGSTTTCTAYRCVVDGIVIATCTVLLIQSARRSKTTNHRVSITVTVYLMLLVCNSMMNWTQYSVGARVLSYALRILEGYFVFPPLMPQLLCRYLTVTPSHYILTLWHALGAAMVLGSQFLYPICNYFYLVHLIKNDCFPLPHLEDSIYESHWILCCLFVHAIVEKLETQEWKMNLNASQNVS
eukprot:PhF_6_TR10695/c0_g1_i1/m.17260